MAAGVVSAKLSETTVSAEDKGSGPHSLLSGKGKEKFEKSYGRDCKYCYVKKTPYKENCRKEPSSHPCSRFSS